MADATLNLFMQHKRLDVSKMLQRADLEKHQKLKEIYNWYLKNDKYDIPTLKFLQKHSGKTLFNEFGIDSSEYICMMLIAKFHTKVL